MTYDTLRACGHGQHLCSKLQLATSQACCDDVTSVDGGTTARACEACARILDEAASTADGAALFAALPLQLSRAHLFPSHLLHNLVWATAVRDKVRPPHVMFSGGRWQL